MQPLSPGASLLPPNPAEVTGGGTAQPSAPMPVGGSIPGSGDPLEANPHSDFVNNVMETVTGMGQTAADMVGSNLTSIGDVVGRVAAVPGQVSTLIQGGINAPPGAIPETPAVDIGAHVDKAISQGSPLIAENPLAVKGSREGKRSGGGDGPPGMKYEKVDFKSQADAYAEERKAIEARSKAEMAALESQNALREEQVKADLAHAEKMQNIANEADAALDARVKAKEATKQAILDQATAIDPDRWMNSRTPGQLFAMVLANGLTQGRAWSQFQTAIDNDVRAQQQSFENRSKQLKDAGAVDDSIYGLYRQQGLDRRDAQLATHDTMNAIFKQRFEAASATSNSEFVKANAAAAIAASQGIEAKNQAAEVNAQNEFKLKQQQLAASVWEAQKKMELEREKFTLTAQAKGEKLEGLKPQMMEELTRDKQLETDVKDLSEKFKGSSGFFNKLAVLVPDAWTDAGEYNIMRQQLMQKFVRSSQHDAPSQKEFDYYEKMLPKAGDQGGMKKFEELIKRIETDRESRVNMYKAGRYDTAGVEADLAKDRKRIDFQKK